MQLSVLLNSNKTSKTTQDPSNYQKLTSSTSALLIYIVTQQSCHLAKTGTGDGILFDWAETLEFYAIYTEVSGP